MKKFQLVLVAMFAATALMAQDYVYLYYNNGKVDEVAISDFDSLSFTKPESKTTGEAERKDGEGTVKVKWVQLWENGPKWAEYNVGAKSATGTDSYGGYYCWGMTIDKDDSEEYYEGEEDIQGGSHDTAKNLWGSNWQMPTKEDFDNLLANCDVVWKTKTTSEYGVAGLLFTGKGDYSGNSVFFPAAGYYYDGRVRNAGSYGYYWSSTPNGNNNAYRLYISSGNQSVLNYSREYGHSVRAVLK